MPTPRERFREQMRDDVKGVALRQLAASGPAGVSINAIGRELGVSGPAIYRYFANRDELLTELVLDAYAELAEATTGARSLGGYAKSYRAWAAANPHRYRLLYSEATPGFGAHQPRLVAAAQSLMDQLVAVLDDHDEKRGVRSWWRIHGFVSLEIEGNFSSMGLDADALFRAEVKAL